LLNGILSGYPSALISQALALSGVNFTLDAACASSLYAIKLACNYLLSGKADLMLAGAVSVPIHFLLIWAFPFSKPIQQRVGRALWIAPLKDWWLEKAREWWF
jgi:3-oxoacyl-(acyl-carrier-protein) synthase